ncbi:hypothetical protein JCM5296_000201 [Sporobolomyces johnsonii]
MLAVNSTARSAAARRLNLASAASLAAGSSPTAALRTRLAHPPSRSYAGAAGRNGRPEARRVEPLKKSQAEASKVIQTIPFVLSPEQGFQYCMMAAYRSFGFLTGLKALFAPFLRRFGYDSGVEHLAFRPVLLPVWKVDLSLEGKAVIDEMQYDLIASVLDASVAGFDHPVLASLSMHSDWAVPPVPFSRSRHSMQHSQEIAILPFTRHPLNLLDKIAAFPCTTTEQHSVMLNPARCEPVLFAAYPMYLPMYLAEFKLGDKYVTAATWATVDKFPHNSAVYRQFEASPQWRRHRRVPLAVELTSSPSSREDRRRGRATGAHRLTLENPQFQRLLTDVTKRAEGGKVVWTDEIVGEGGVDEVIRASERVMGYAEWAEVNREYVGARDELLTMQSVFEDVKELPEGARITGSILGEMEKNAGITNGSSLGEIRKSNVVVSQFQMLYNNMKRNVEQLKPDWVKKFDKAREEEKRKRRGWNTGRGRAAGRNGRPAARRVEQVKKSQAEASKIIQTIPFVLSPDKGRAFCKQAALDGFGISYDSGIELVAFRPVLVPVWRIDLTLAGKALINETQYDLLVSVDDGSIAGFDHPQLGSLPMQSDWAVTPVPFSQSRHSTQHSQEITILPFTRQPLKFVDKLLASPPTTAERHGMVFDPAQFETLLFALYPVYIPLYLGEFKLGDKHVTTAAFATTNEPDYAHYRQVDPVPEWSPRSPPRLNYPVFLSGFPSSCEDRQRAQETGVLEVTFESPQVVRLMQQLMEDARNSPADESSPLTRDEIEGEGGVDEVIKGSDRVMGFAEWSEINGEYAAALHALRHTQAAYEKVKDIHDAGKIAVMIGPSGQIAGSDVVLEALQSKYNLAKRNVERHKPEWVKKFDKAREEEKRKRRGWNTGRGR